MNISTRSIARLGAIMGLLLALMPSAARGFDKSFWAPGFVNGKNYFPIFHKLGVTIFQERLNWDLIAPTRPGNPTDPRDPAYHWPAMIDREMAQARKYHMRVLFQLMFTPGWANGGQPHNWAPSNSDDFAAFAAAAAHRYRSVHLWMVWGEPGRSSNFAPLTAATPGTKLNQQQQEAPHKYAQMLDAAYGSLKRVRKSNLVIGGCTYSAGEIDTQAWIENLRLPNGKPPRMDIYSHNPFGWREPKFGVRPSAGGQVQFPDLPRLAHWVDKNLGRPRHVRKPLPIFLSEWNEPTAPEQEFAWWLDRNVAAKWTSEALQLSRNWGRIYGLGWIELYDAPPFENAGLLTTRGKRKSDFWAFARG